jgi:hypothetical protein
VFRLTQEDAPAGRVAQEVQAERVSFTRFNNNEPRAQVKRTDSEDRFGLNTEGQGGANLRPRWLSLQERAGPAGMGLRNASADHQDARRDPPLPGRHYQEDERGLERGPSEGAVIFSSCAFGAAAGSSGALHSADVNLRPGQGKRSGAMPSSSPHISSQPVTGLVQGTAQVGQAPWARGPVQPPPQYAPQWLPYSAAQDAPALQAIDAQPQLSALLHWSAPRWDPPDSSALPAGPSASAIRHGTNLLLQGHLRVGMLLQHILLVKLHPGLSSCPGPAQAGYQMGGLHQGEHASNAAGKHFKMIKIQQFKGTRKEEGTVDVRFIKTIEMYRDAVPMMQDEQLSMLAMHNMADSAKD